VPVSNLLNPVRTQTGESYVNISHQPAFVQKPLYSIGRKIVLVVCLITSVRNPTTRCVGESVNVPGLMCIEIDDTRYSFPLVVKISISVIECSYCYINFAFILFAAK